MPCLREREERGRPVVLPSERLGDVERGAQVFLRVVVTPEERLELPDVGGDRPLTRDAVERDVVRERLEQRQELGRGVGVDRARSRGWRSR